MSLPANLNNISIVLQRPRYPENIGAAVRAMRNMGIGSLIVSEPQNYDRARVLKMATHTAVKAVDNIQIHTNLKDALAPFHYIVGTTARLGKQRQEVFSPAQIAEKTHPISLQNKVAFLFGPEDRGLTNEDLWFCHALVNIPTAEFSSLNLAQAVMVVCYELFKASDRGLKRYNPRLANSFELENMYEHLKDVLIRISFLNPENPEYWLNNLRTFFSRLQLRAKDVSLIRGICRQVDWYSEKRYQDGLQSRNKHDAK
jgi:tRNA/rRNA methyltransferase